MEKWTGSILVQYNKPVYCHPAYLTIMQSQFSSLTSRVRRFVTPRTVAHQASLSITNSRSSLKLMSIGSVMPYNYLILCRPFLLLPSIFLNIKIFSYELLLPIQSTGVSKWPKYWSLNFSISPSSEYSGLIFFRMDWLDLLAVQGTLKSLLQHHRSNHQLFSTQLS